MTVSVAAKTANAVIKQLAELPDACLTVNLAIEADPPNGIGEQLRRTVLENANTLKFNNAEFEESYT